MAENKTKSTKVNVDDYVDALPEEAKRTDSKTLIKLMERLTGEKPKMWGPSIVGFGNVHYKYESGREGDMPIAAFSPRKPAIAVYGMNSFPEATGLMAQLGKCKLQGSCLHIKRLADIDLQILEAMIVKSIGATRQKYSG
jgi:hypothetical protein